MLDMLENRARGRASLFCLWWWNPLVAGTREVERLEAVLARQLGQEEGEAVSTEQCAQVVRR